MNTGTSRITLVSLDHYLVKVMALCSCVFKEGCSFNSSADVDTVLPSSHTNVPCLPRAQNSQEALRLSPAIMASALLGATSWHELTVSILFKPVHNDSAQEGHCEQVQRS